MGKQPAFWFYPGDWVQDTRPLSLAAKGAWIDLLCAMWRAPRRGALALSLTGYARLLGATVEQARLVLDELIALGVCDADVAALSQVTAPHAPVTLVNRRMQREESQKHSGRLRSRRYRRRLRDGAATVDPSPSLSDSETQKTFSPESEPYRLAALLWELIRARNPGHKPPGLQAWARHVDLMLRLDGRSPQDIEALIRKAQADPFWQNNILSTAKLREKYDQLYLKLQAPPPQNRSPSGPQAPWRFPDDEK